MNSPNEIDWKYVMQNFKIQKEKDKCFWLSREENKQLKKDNEDLKQQLSDLQKYKLFHDHIKSHFEKEHPDWDVKCKICNKNFSEILKNFRGDED